MKAFFLFYLVIISYAAIGQTVVKTLSPKKFKNQIAVTKEAVILDVRTSKEVAEGAISGAVNIDFNNTNFEKEIAGLDKSKSYFVYCAAGVRSLKAAKVMENAGFKKIYNLDGGYNAWKEQR